MFFFFKRTVFFSGLGFLKGCLMVVWFCFSNVKGEKVVLESVCLIFY